MCLCLFLCELNLSRGALGLCDLAAGNVVTGVPGFCCGDPHTDKSDTKPDTVKNMGLSTHQSQATQQYLIAPSDTPNTSRMIHLLRLKSHVPRAAVLAGHRSWSRQRSSFLFAGGGGGSRKSTTSSFFQSSRTLVCSFLFPPSVLSTLAAPLPLYFIIFSSSLLRGSPVVIEFNARYPNPNCS